MKKSDLRTGMLVTLRNKEEYYVMLNTGSMFQREKDVLVHKIGDSLGWMPLSEYDEDMYFHDDPESIFPTTEEEDRAWDIMAIDNVHSIPDMFCTGKYKTIWMRKEQSP